MKDHFGDGLRMYRTIGLVVMGVLVTMMVSVGGGTALAEHPDATLAHQGESHSPPAAEEAFVVQLSEDGDANITWTMSVMNLSDETESQVFENLRANSTWQEDRVTQFESQWQSIVADASEETGREMAVSNTAIEFEEVENSGVIRLSLTWEGLAATSGEEVVLTEPFVTMSESPWPLYVGLPDGYEAAELTVETDPADQSETHLAWNEESDLSGFALTAVQGDDDSGTGDDPTESDGSGASETDGAADGTGPGFGIVAALAGLMGWWRLSARN